MFRVPTSAFRVRGHGAVKYYVRIGDRTVEVELDGNRVVVEGKVREAHLATIPGTPLYHLLLSGASWTLAAEALDGVGRWALGVAGERVEVEVRSEQGREIEAPAPNRPGPPGQRTVRAPMPGLVVRVEVAAGQHVEGGAGLVVVEAMKMENELRAPQPGVVATVHVEVGQAVEKGAPLVTLASPEASG
jgi:biotin carboxyl carrier protein